MAQQIKETACNAGDTGDAGSIPGLGRWVKRRGEGIVDDEVVELRGPGVG